MNENRYQGNPCKRGHSGIRYKRDRRCVVCSRDKARVWFQSDAGKKYSSERHILKQYNMTPEQLKQMFDKQDGECLICKLKLVIGGRLRNSACVDHNHLTGEVRGLLCNHCNRALGLFNDNVGNILRAAEYLR